VTDETVTSEASINEWNLAHVPNRLTSHWGQSISIRVFPSRIAVYPSVSHFSVDKCERLGG
jgi:hypothetical protein